MQSGCAAVFRSPSDGPAGACVRRETWPTGWCRRTKRQGGLQAGDEVYTGRSGPVLDHPGDNILHKVRHWARHNMRHILQASSLVARDPQLAPMLGQCLSIMGCTTSQARTCPRAGSRRPIGRRGRQGVLTVCSLAAGVKVQACQCPSAGPASARTADRQVCAGPPIA